ncbi:MULTISPECIES: hypothetical protein [unclassified Polaribacter]|nr:MULTISPECIES: hypothetical protein [unclassified Polaribacter]
MKFISHRCPSYEMVAINYYKKSLLYDKRRKIAPMFAKPTYLPAGN